jgi:hypothetical protein
METIEDFNDNQWYHIKKKRVEISKELTSLHIFQHILHSIPAALKIATIKIML